MKETKGSKELKRRWEKIGLSVNVSVFLFMLLFLGATGSDCLYGKNSGLKYSRSYSPEDTKLQPQNWYILQDKRGVVYVANQGGILEYTGVSWKSILVPNDTVRSLAIDNTGTIYVGGINELGYLAPDVQGQLKYRSLVEHIDGDKKNFKVWRTHSTKAGIFFRTSYYFFRWLPKQKKMELVLQSENKEADKINGSFICGENLIVTQRGVGLLRWEKDSLQPMLGGDLFASKEKWVVMIVPYDLSGKRLLIGTSEAGFYIYDGNNATRFHTEVDEYLKENKAYYGLRLSKSADDIVIATKRGGIVVIDLDGKLKYLFSKESGLLNNSVKYVYEDFQGNLWAALADGISKIEYLSPHSIYDKRVGLTGAVLAVSRYSNRIYAGTGEGLFFLSPENDRFYPVPGVTNMCSSLLSVGDFLLAATDTGIIYLNHNNSVQLITGTPSFVLTQSIHNPSRIWAGMRNSVISLRKNSKQQIEEWKKEFEIKGINQQIISIVEDGEGDLWLGARGGGVFKIDFSDKSRVEDYQIVRYNTTHRLPSGEIQVFNAAGEVKFGGSEGLFRFDGMKKEFVPDNTMGKNFTDKYKDIFRLVEDRNKNIWFHSRGRNFLAIPKAEHSYEINEKNLARIPINWQVNDIFPDTMENVTWFATHKGLVRYNIGTSKSCTVEYSAIISRVLVNGTPQFYDHYMANNTGLVSKNTESSVPVLDYKDRNLRFEFAAPFFEDEAMIEYRCFLEGYDDGWSEWSSETKKDYTNLDSGNYTFSVRAKNIYGTISREALFKFEILPPWYMTWWAFLLYSLLAFLLVFTIVRWRSWKLEQDKQSLEKIIIARTKEINQKNRQLEEQTDLLKEQAEKLKGLDHAKSRFFANISHEFRTPLTLIIGPLEQMLSVSLPATIKNRLDVMQRNSRRLLILINRLLDLSRIDSGKLKLQAAPLDIISFLKGILSSFEQEAREKKLELSFHSLEESITLYYDVERMEDVFGNVFSNAVKFTPSRGKITVSVKPIIEEEEDFPSGSLEISVRDTGIGISKEQLTHIFDRFYQVDSKKQKGKGSGIGLALTRELVVLHHGKIDVNSRVGENSGTEFIIRFPLGKNHLKADEIGDPPDGTVDLEKKSLEDGFEVLEEGMKEPGTFGTSPGLECQEKVQGAGKQTILVVEDNPDMRRYIRESIEPHYKVVEAEDGVKGIKIAQDLMPDLVVSDIMMPEVDGYELCRTLKEDFKTSHIPVILLTAKASEGSVVEGLETGADDYITKPFSTKILGTRIKNLIDQRRQLQEKIQKEVLMNPEELKLPSIDQRFLKKLHDIIEKNLSDPDLNVEALSEKMDISRVTLNKKIQALTNESATHFIRSFRLKRAMQLLKGNYGTVLDVAMAVGFSSSAYFTKCFKEEFGQLPSECLSKESI